MKLFNLRDSWPWALVLSIITLPVIKAVTYNNGHLPVGAWIALVVTIVCAWGIAALRYITRWKWIKSIDFTIFGIFIIGANKRNIPSSVISNAVNETIDFWGAHGINFGTLSVSMLDRVMVFSDEPITLHGFGNWADKIVRGFASPGVIGIYWDSNDPSRSIRTIKHEIGHWCLDAMGITDEAAAHKKMADEGFTF